MEGVEQTLIAQDAEMPPQAQLEANTMQDKVNLQAPTIVPPNGVEQVADASSPKEDKAMEEPQKNVVMCTALVAHSVHESDAKWVPPPVTHEFSYPSDEEITPNPKASFTTALLPRLGQVRSWFKGVEEPTRSSTSTSHEEARLSAPCLPITVGKGSLSDGDQALASDTSPRRYVDIASRLPQNQEGLQHVADRPGANTRLKSIAIQRMKKAPSDEAREHDDLRDGALTDPESPASLEVLPNSPHYLELNASIPSEGEDYQDVLNSAPAHMAVDGLPEDAQHGDPPSHGGPHGASLEEQVQEQRQMMNELAAKFDRLVELVTSSTQNAPAGGAPPPIVDP